ncbi:helix-turn-helix domain-containing protein [Streptomyces virginiae]|uniref:helix-turn-helix domain-containing protein n=1 Tax=Streptomyces virginiae TaxID=1961 RepID=UPI0036EEC4C7
MAGRRRRHAVTLRCRDAQESITAIAPHLGVGRSTLYRALAACGEAIATGREPGITQGSYERTEEAVRRSTSPRV